MSKIDINSITSEKLKNGEYQSSLPEYYELKKFSETNPWHLNQNVFDHVVAVFAGWETISSLSFLNETTKEKVTKYLETRQGKFTKRQLLIVATLLHDIAKTVTLIKSPSGNTSCPGHEAIGSLMADDFATRFDLDPEGIALVKKIVLFHGFAHDVLGLIKAKNIQKQYLQILMKVAPESWVELLLLAYADMLGSDLEKANPQELQTRETLITQLLES